MAAAEGALTETARCASANFFIDGRWRAAHDGARLEIRDPANGERVGSTALAGAADVDAAVQAAKRALPGWAATHPDARAQHPASRGRSDRGARRRHRRSADARAGQAAPDSEKEIRFGVEVIRYYAEEGRRIGGSLRASSRSDIRSLVVSSPVGVVGAITPWNYPVDIYAWKVGPALAAGCTLVVKPPHETPLAIGLVARCFEEAGLPAGRAQRCAGNRAGRRRRARGASRMCG